MITRTEEAPASTPLLTVPEVARRLHLSISQTYTLLQEGTVPGFRIGKSWRIDPAVLDAWIDGLAQTRPDPGPEQRAERGER